MPEEKRYNQYIEDGICFDENISLESDIEDSTINQDEYKNISIYARDWTVGTFISQIEQGNVDLNPEFQRRNAWDDNKRSRLIESLIYGLPVPEIVLAEQTHERKKFIVIDGKQRLITIAGFCMPDRYNVWTKPRLQRLKNNSILNGKSYTDFADSMDEYKRMLDNALLRCSVIINYQDEGVLFDIFYRLNSGSVPLTTQELRQALIRGEFSAFLIQETDRDNVLRKVLGLKAAHKRLVDVEILLRIISFNFFWEEYNGNLKVFLDESMKRINKEWRNFDEMVKFYVRRLYDTIDVLKIVFDDYKKIGRKYISATNQEPRFNRALFECLVLCFDGIDVRVVKEKKEEFINKFALICSENTDFKLSIDSTTKTIQSYACRFDILKNIVKEVFGVENNKFTFDRDVK